MQRGAALRATGGVDINTLLLRQLQHLPDNQKRSKGAQE
jgi:hypothetical protein